MRNTTTVNKVILVGRVSREPRVHTTGDHQFLSFSVITTENIKRNGTTEVHEELHQIKIALDQLGEKTISKGQTVYIQGKLQTHKFTDEQNIKRYRAEIVANQLEFLGEMVPVS